MANNDGNEQNTSPTGQTQIHNQFLFKLHTPVPPTVVQETTEGSDLENGLQETNNQTGK